MTSPFEDWLMNTKLGLVTSILVTMGYIGNFIKLCIGVGDVVTGWRVVGALFPPLGVVLGYF